MHPYGLRARAFAVHILTAAGAGFALMALVEAGRGEWANMFLLLGGALVVDGIDGTFARRLQVDTVLPRWSGEILDMVVDFATYVFVPAYAIVAGGLLPPTVDAVLGIAIVMSAAIYFADREMKAVENYFRGFPALWNVVAFYLFLLEPARWSTAVAVALLVGLTFAPFLFMHPVRVRRLRGLNVGLLGIWSLLALVTLLRDFAAGPWVTAGLCLIGLYFCTFGLVHPREPVTDV